MGSLDYASLNAVCIPAKSPMLPCCDWGSARTAMHVRMSAGIIHYRGVLMVPFFAGEGFHRGKANGRFFHNLSRDCEIFDSIELDKRTLVCRPQRPHAQCRG